MKKPLILPIVFLATLILVTLLDAGFDAAIARVETGTLRVDWLDAVADGLFWAIMSVVALMAVKKWKRWFA